MRAAICVDPSGFHAQADEAADEVISDSFLTVIFDDSDKLAACRTLHLSQDDSASMKIELAEKRLRLATSAPRRENAPRCF